MKYQSRGIIFKNNLNIKKNNTEYYQSTLYNKFISAFLCLVTLQIKDINS